MTSRDFCYWLQGYFELTGGMGADAIPADRAMMIKRHLALVFNHEIDPSIDGGDPKKAKELQDIHDAMNPKPSGVQYRC